MGKFIFLRLIKWPKIYIIGQFVALHFHWVLGINDYLNRNSNKRRFWMGMWLSKICYLAVICFILENRFLKRRILIQAQGYCMYLRNEFVMQWKEKSTSILLDRFVCVWLFYVAFFLFFYPLFIFSFFPFLLFIFPLFSIFHFLPFSHVALLILEYFLEHCGPVMYFT